MNTYVPSEPPPVGARVQGRMSGRQGLVQRYRPNRLGVFPVAWLDGSGLWSVAGVDDVLVVADAEPRQGAA